MRASGTSLLFVASLCSTGCVATLDDAGSGTGALVVTGHCEVYGAGAIASGDALDGDIRDLAGTPSGTWSHTTDTLDQLVGDPDTLICRVNGSKVADVEGTGTWNGAAGHHFRAHVQDRGDPTAPTIIPGATETETLTGTRTYSPSRWADGELTFSAGATVAIPATMPVTVGNAGNHWTWLTFVLADDLEPVRCMYRGGASRANPTSPADIARGRTVTLVRCERFGHDEHCDDDRDHHGHGDHHHGHGDHHHGRGDHDRGHGDHHRGHGDHGRGHGDHHHGHGDHHRGHGDHHHGRCDHDRDCGDRWLTDPTLVAGSELEVASIELHVQQGSNRFPSRRCPVTTVSIDLEVTPFIEVPAEADYYRITVWDPAGALVHFAEGDLVDGDLAVALLP